MYQMILIRSCFKYIILHKTKPMNEITGMLLIVYFSLITTNPDACTAFNLYSTTQLERWFFKLEIIKNYLRNTMIEKRPSSLYITSI